MSSSAIASKSSSSLPSPSPSPTAVTLDEDTPMAGSLDDDKPVVVIKTVVLKFPEGETIELPFSAAKQSSLIANTINQLPTSSKSETVEFPVNDFSFKVMSHAVRYLIHHDGNPTDEIAMPLKSTKMSECVSKWDADFVDNMSKYDLYLVTCVANKYDIQSLVHLCCAKVASFIKGIDLPKIKEVLNTPEMEEINAAAKKKKLEAMQKKIEEEKKAAAEEMQQFAPSSSSSSF